jgi:uncharacterized protein YegP (UPF0339 family)
MAAKFVLKKGSTGKFRFNLVATNGQVIATSEAYESKASANKGIESVKRNAPPPRSTTRPTSSRLFRSTPASALLQLVIPRHAEVATTCFVQIARARSSNAMATRRLAGASTPVRSGLGEGSARTHDRQ